MLEEKGRRDHEEMAEFSVKFYYTNQVIGQANNKTVKQVMLSVPGEHGRY